MAGITLDSMVKNQQLKCSRNEDEWHGVSGWPPWGEVVGGRIPWHEIPSWMLLSKREVEWCESGTKEQEENFFFLGPVVLGVKRKHSYLLRKIKISHDFRESQFLVRRWIFRKKGWGYREVCWLTRGHSERKEKKSTKQHVSYSLGEKELMGELEHLETDINCEVNLMVAIGDTVGKAMTQGWVMVRGGGWGYLVRTFRLLGLSLH